MALISILLKTLFTRLKKEARRKIKEEKTLFYFCFFFNLSSNSFLISKFLPSFLLEKEKEEIRNLIKKKELRRRGKQN